MCAGLFPGEAPQKTQMTVGGVVEDDIAVIGDLNDLIAQYFEYWWE